MREDPFAWQVSRLAHEHQQRHTTAVVAHVCLRGWLAMRNQYADPFDPAVFDRVDAALTQMPASREAPRRPAPRRAA